MIKSKFVKKSLSLAFALVLSAALILPGITGQVYAAGQRLIPLGMTTGIKMFSGGAMIVGFASEEATGSPSAADKGGLEVGDIILKINGVCVESNEELSKALSELDESFAVFTVNRGGQETDVTVQNLIPGENGGYKLGAWVRDSMAGIGTITYVDPSTGNFGALGHGICDVDTGLLMPLSKGSTMPSEVIDVVKGTSGSPGQLVGSFDMSRTTGVLYKNTSQGIFGKLTDSSVYKNEEAVEVAATEDVKCGKIEIIANVNGTEKQVYTAEITKILDTNPDSSRSFSIKITDDRLKNDTGGIVQGMSGSPILQNGKLVGAVTHVLINDPTQGYGILAENMLAAAN